MIRYLLVAISLSIWGLSAHANDAAAETAAGGIQLRQEHSVAMEKERLFISEDLVRVEYEFRNTSKEPVTSEVAFPIPPYGLSFMDPMRDFGDFKAWTDGEPVEVSKEVRAFVKDRDVTDALQKAGLSLQQFGHFEDGAEIPRKPTEITKLAPEVREELVRIGALDAPDPAHPEDTNLFPRWDLHITYHWTQTFPPRKVVRVKHEYGPGYGFAQFVPEDLENGHPYVDVEPRIREYIKNRRTQLGRDGGLFVSWIDYILTTANTWQGPIKDFQLTVKKPDNGIAAFSWGGALQKMEAKTFRLRQRNFKPEHELRVYFADFSPGF